MARIGKFFKKGGPKNVEDEASVMAKGNIKGIVTEQELPVDAADTPADVPVNSATTATSPAVMVEERDEATELPAFDLGSSASMSMTMQSVEDGVLNSLMHSHIDRDIDDGVTCEDDDKSFVTTAMETDVTAKYFHKDVVVNCLDDNGLIIRAMYCIPKPIGEDHVVVKVEAATITPRDVMNCNGFGLSKDMLPYVPGYDLVGTIQALGEKSKADGVFRRGDRVAGVSASGGSNSRFISIPANRLNKISDKIKSTNAVCLLHDYMAALKTLRIARNNGSPYTGRNILITDGFSPVGQAIINLAGLEGANVYCCAIESKHPYLATLGVKCFPKDPEDWLPAAAQTFDVVVDNTCHDGYSSSRLALNKRGTLVCLGPTYNIDLGNEVVDSSGCSGELAELQQKWSALKAKYMMSQTHFLNTETLVDDDNEQYRQDLKYLMFLCERGLIKPKIANRVSLDDVPEAHRLLQIGKSNGTVVCVPWIEE